MPPPPPPQTRASLIGSGPTPDHSASISASPAALKRPGRHIHIAGGTRIGSEMRADAGAAANAGAPTTAAGAARPTRRRKARRFIGAPPQHERRNASTMPKARKSPAKKRAPRPNGGSNHLRAYATARRYDGSDAVTLQLVFPPADAARLADRIVNALILNGRRRRGA